MLIEDQDAYYLSRQVVEPQVSVFFLIVLIGLVGKCEKKGVASGLFGPALEFHVLILEDGVVIGESLVRGLREGLLVTQFHLELPHALPPCCFASFACRNLFNVDKPWK